MYCCLRRFAEHFVIVAYTLRMKRSLDVIYDPNSSHAKHERRTKSCGFQIYPVDKFNCKFPYFREPKEVGSFSHDADRNFQHNRDQLMYYEPPANIEDVSFDLRDGYDIFNKKDDSVKEKLDDLLKWISLNKSKFLIENQTNQLEQGRRDEWYYILLKYIN